ncbi:MAG: NADH-quinone oxidoreductase subunit N [Deltaproteobacteria bacterium]
MTGADLIALLPFLILGGTPVVVMLAIAWRRHHGLTLGLTIVGLAAAFLALFGVFPRLPQQTTPLIALDSYAFFYTGLIVAASLAVAVLSYDHLKKREVIREEFYILLLLATLGSAVLAASTHFISFFLGLELLSVALYPMIAYERKSDRSTEAGIKYLILAAVSASFLIFGMALVYNSYGTMEFSGIGARFAAPGGPAVLAVVGFALIVVGIGFKLGVAPFHMWTPDIFEGAPAPVTGYVASVSKGAMFALLLRAFTQVPLPYGSRLFMIFTVIAIISMFAGNLLALFQKNVKRLLAYSSIAHLGYLLVAFLASGPLRAVAVTFYLAAYFITTLGAFGVVAVLSDHDRDADDLEDYRGLFRRSPWLTVIMTAMLLSLAGMPLTAGFLGKFYLVAAGAGSSLWMLVIVLLVNSTIGLFYYLRLIAVMFATLPEAAPSPAVPTVSAHGHLVLGVLLGLLLWLGILPAPFISFIHLLIPTAG